MSYATYIVIQKGWLLFWSLKSEGTPSWQA